MELRSVQIVFEDRPLLRLNVNGKCIDYPLREEQLIPLALQALNAIRHAPKQGRF
jgi:hypothetical protein